MALWELWESGSILKVSQRPNKFSLLFLLLDRDLISYMMLKMFTIEMLIPALDSAAVKGAQASQATAGNFEISACSACVFTG